jgi:flagellar protein FliL
MAEATKEEVAVAAAPKSGMVGKLLNVAAIFAASLTAVVAGGFINASLHTPPEYVLNAKDGRIRVFVPPPPKTKAKEAKKQEDKEHKPAVFYSLDPPLVVNFEDASAVRFLQVGVDVMARDPKAIEAVQKLSPLIRNNLLLVISNREYQTLMSADGKEALRSDALKELRKIIKKEAPDSEVEELLFTSFIVQ